LLSVTGLGSLTRSSPDPPKKRGNLNRIAMRTALPLITAGAVLLAGAGTGAAAPADEPVPADGATIVLNDGRVVGADDRRSRGRPGCCPVRPCRGPWPAVTPSRGRSAPAPRPRGAILAKAKVSVDSSISNSWTWNATQTVTDTNNTSKGYRAGLGQVGWKLTGVKTWIAPPCNVKKKTITVVAPRKGDMSIGRQNS